MGIIERIDELISEAEKEPSWTATQALRCLRKEMLKEQPEIVWCKDCENNISGRCRNLDLWVETDPEWFCADGRKKGTK